MGKIIGIIVLVAVLVFAGIALFSLNFVYSSGERTGFVQKFSKRGWVCKTWEGEMAMVTMPGTLSEKFPFTVSDERVAAAIGVPARIVAAP